MINADLIYQTILKSPTFTFPKKEKYYMLNYIKAISNSGQDEKLAINNKIIEYKKRKKPLLLYIMKVVKEEIDKGKPFAKALLLGKVLNEREFHILMSSKGGLAAGIEKIIETNKKSSKSFAGFALLLIPPSIMITTLYVTHDMVKNVLVSMVQPIVSAGGTPPPLPAYLEDPSIYLYVNIVFYSLIALFVTFMFILKNKFPEKYLRVIPIIEEEYVLDILKSIKSVSDGGGINLANTAKALSNGETNKIKKAIFEEIIERTSYGKEKISEIFEKYGANYNTISSLKIGEDSNNISIGLNIALEDLENRYKRDIGIFLKVGLWGGQLSMITIAGKPLIDIMLIMSVNQMNFKL